MRGNTPLKMAVATAAIALIAAGCTSIAEPPKSDTGGELRIFATEPSSLLPTAATDNPSLNIIRQLYKGLVEYDAKTGAAVNAIADTIESRVRPLGVAVVIEATHLCMSMRGVFQRDSRTRGEFLELIHRGRSGIGSPGGPDDGTGREDR